MFLPVALWGTLRGMLIVERIAKIRRQHFNKGFGIKTICRKLNLSMKVVRKVLRLGATEFTCTRTVQLRPQLTTTTAALAGSCRTAGLAPDRCPLRQPCPAWRAFCRSVAGTTASRC